ncbi:helix-turn-helix transcriptional regulator [Thiobacillus sp.]|uniref:helix-turn-helix domain-containing protein n=1 Tax=Thiobacillus sp. TaxID=924 RepID=UPI0025E6A61B|nr:helix-turn-helix transcriptional regulator [Thiobacillus sp.]MBT9540374.1 helix-turn-helix transcriptional regulator [Thiobacillus sp.]
MSKEKNNKPKLPRLVGSGNEIDKSLDAGMKTIGLTSREIQILRQLAQGKGDKKIAIDLLISVKTVNHHVSNIMLKLNATNRTHAVAKALLARQIEIRTTDIPAQLCNRRMGDRDKMSKGDVANMMQVDVGYQIPRHVEEALPRPASVDTIQSLAAI